MKKIIYSIFIFVIAITLNSCSSYINVVQTWSGDNAKTIKDANILVITRAQNPKIRIAFEDAMAKQLRERGYKAIESYKQYPKLISAKKISAEKKEELKAKIESDGFNSIVFSVLKEELQNVKASEEGDYYAGVSLSAYYPPYIPVYSYGFYGSYWSPSYMFYNTKTYEDYGTYVESDIEVETSKSYILESLAYNLELPVEKQLVAMVKTRVDEPDNFNAVAKGYAKKVMESFD